MFADIGGIVDHHPMSWGERWFLLILVKLLTITQCIEVRCDFCWYWWNCWPSFNEFRWEVILLILVELLTIIQWVEVRGDFCWYWCNHWHHSMSWCERWFLLILVELLTITEWVTVRGDFCWYWWNCWPSLNVLRWEVIFVDIGGIVDHHSMSWSEIWLLLILVELLTITQWVEVRGYFCWYWWNCWSSLNELKWDVILVDIGGIVDHHSMSLGERWFLLILVELLTIIQWVEVRCDFCWYWWNCWHHWMSWYERWCLLILVELFTITQWVKVRGDF